MKTHLLAGTLLLTLTAAAAADTLKVPQDFETIQAAVNAATGEDTVSISSGNYVENVVIPLGKDGLTLTGKGKVFISAHGLPEVDGDGDGILIQSSDVTISKLVIRHADSAGVRASSPLDGEPVGLSGITLEKVTIINSNSAGIQITAHGTTVDNCLLVGNGDGLNITGDDARVVKTRVLNDCDTGIDITGDDAVVENCTVHTIEDGGGIEVTGQRATVKKNSVSKTDGSGIDVDGGTGHLVESNRVDSADGDGIEVDGDDSVVQKNAVDSCCENGIDVFGNNLVVASNTVTDCPDDSDGIIVTGPNVTDGINGSVGSLIEKNKVFDAVEEGYNLSIFDSTVSKNQAVACGAEDEAGFCISGNGNTIENNTAKNGDDTGFEISGSNNTLTKNKASDNTDNGILIDGTESTNNVLDGNSVSNNFGDGIQNGGVGTVIRKNKLKNNYQDLSNETGSGASLVDEGGNSFGTGGLTAEPVLD